MIQETSSTNARALTFTNHVRSALAPILLGCWALSSVACGGAKSEPEAPPPSETNTTPVEPSPPPAAETEPTTEEKPAEAAAAEPAFRPGMSVNEAIDAVPQSADRINIEQEALAAPLMNADLYAPCVKGHEHFSLRVAIWDGRAVGVDVSTTPKNDKAAACIREQVEKLSWPDKAKSLNTVSFNY